MIAKKSSFIHSLNSSCRTQRLTPHISPKATLEERIQGVRTPVQKKPFYFGKDRRAELRAASAQAKQKTAEKHTSQHGKDTHELS